MDITSAHSPVPRYPVLATLAVAASFTLPACQQAGPAPGTPPAMHPHAQELPGWILTGDEAAEARARREGLLTPDHQTPQHP